MDSTGQNDIVEEFQMEIYEDTADGCPTVSPLKRSRTDAQYRPQLRVRFNSLAIGIERQLSRDAPTLLSDKAHQIGRAQHARGWQNTILTKRRKGFCPSNEEEELDEIAQAMVKDQILMKDTIDGEVYRRNAFREMTRSLRFKKEVKRRLSDKRHSHTSSRRLSYFDIFKYSLSMNFYHFKQRVGDALQDNSLWHKELKRIEGIYGSSVGIYFRFLRYLFLLNLSISFLVIGFLLIPQILFDSSPSYLQGGNILLRDEMAKDNVESLEEVKVKFGVLDWLTGEGWMNTTALYYGGYITGNLSLPYSSLSYDVSQSYFFTIIACFIMYLIILLIKVFCLYKENYIDTEEDLNLTFVQKVLSAWDFSITDVEAANIKHSSIYIELTEILQEIQDEEESKDWCGRFKNGLVQFFTWFVMFGFLILLGWGMYLLLREELFDLSQETLSYFKTCMGMLVYPVVVTLLMVFIPILLEEVVKHEGYSRQRFQLYVTLIRVILLGLIILGVVVLFWYSHSPGLIDELKEKESIRYYRFHSEKAENVTVSCWENALGQEIYRLVLVDFLFIIFSNFCIDFIKSFMVKKNCLSSSIQEFSIARNTLHLIYNQTLLWIGLFFCPLIPIVISLKFLIIFYSQKFSMMQNLVPHSKPFKAGQTETLFYALTLFSFILAFFSFGFILVRGYSSPSCGPFQGFVHYIDLAWTLSEDSEQLFMKILVWILKPGSVIVLLVALGIAVYCMRSIADGREEMARLLRKQLALEVKDRAFLQQLIEKVQRGEYMPGSPMQSPTNSPNCDNGPIEESFDKKSSFIFSKNRVSPSIDEDEDQISFLQID